MATNVKRQKPTELTIMSDLFNKFISETTCNTLIGSIAGTTLGLLFRRPKIGFFMGVGFPVGLTYNKYSLLLDQVRFTKLPPTIKEYYGPDYYMQKLSIMSKKINDKYKQYKRS